MINHKCKLAIYSENLTTCSVQSTNPIVNYYIEAKVKYTEGHDNFGFCIGARH